MVMFSTPGCELEADRVLWCRLVGWEPAGSLLNEYTLEILSLRGDLLVAVTVPYLKVMVALVIPGTSVCNMEKNAGACGKLIKAAGSSALVFAHGSEGVTIKFLSHITSRSFCLS
jgi:hypothetical protein